MSDLFDIQNTLSFNTDKLTEGKEYDYVTRTSLNQGILQTTGFVNKENINPAGTWSLGLLQMDFFYRNKPWYAGQFVRKIVPKIEIPNKAKLFFQTILNLQKSVLLQVLVRNVDETFRNINVQLPQTSNKEIDFEFIEEFVRELERARLRELEAYLVATGLNNYELTATDKAALNSFQYLKWKEFRIGDVFEKLSAKKAQKANVRKYKNSEFSVPVVYCKYGDNGIMYWGRQGEFTTYKDVISIVYNGVIAAGKVYAQKEATGILAESYFIKMKNTKESNHLSNLFCSTVLEKVLYPLYSRDHLATWDNKVENDKIWLPITNEGQIDLVSMNQIIASLQKIVIADVAKYTARNLEATQQVIEAQEEPEVEQTITPLITEPKETEKYISLLPVYSLRAACGYFGDGEEVEELGWMHVEGMGRLNKDMFVVQAVGQSMEPHIHNGDYCVFKKYSGGSRQGKIVLAQHRGYFDEDNAGAYSIKEYSSEKSYNDDGSWQHESITLRPFNPAYEPIRINEEDAESFAIIGEYVGVVTL